MITVSLKVGAEMREGSSPSPATKYNLIDSTRGIGLYEFRAVGGRVRFSSSPPKITYNWVWSVRFGQGSGMLTQGRDAQYGLQTV